MRMHWIFFLKMYPIKLNKVKQLRVFIVYTYQLFRPKPEQLFSKCLNIGNIDIFFPSALIRFQNECTWKKLKCAIFKVRCNMVYTCGCFHVSSQ